MFVSFDISSVNYLDMKYESSINPVISEMFENVDGLTTKSLVYSGLQIRVYGKLFSLFLIQNICNGYSKERSQ